MSLKEQFLTYVIPWYYLCSASEPIYFWLICSATGNKWKPTFQQNYWCFVKFKLITILLMRHLTSLFLLQLGFFSFLRWYVHICISLQSVAWTERWWLGFFCILKSWHRNTHIPWDEVVEWCVCIGSSLFAFQEFLWVLSSKAMKRTADYKITCNVDFSFPESVLWRSFISNPSSVQKLQGKLQKQHLVWKFIQPLLQNLLRPAEGTDLHSTHGHPDGMETRGKPTKHAWGQNDAT